VSPNLSLGHYRAQNQSRLCDLAHICVLLRSISLTVYLFYNMHPSIIAIASLCLFAAHPLTASPSEILSFESISSRIRNHNPELAAARFRIDEAVGLAKQSGRLSNPSFDSGISSNTRANEGNIEIGLTQKFPLTDRLRIEKEISATEIQVAEAEVKNVERLLISDARQEFVKILAIRERKSLLKQQQELAIELAEFISEKSKQGEISPLDAAQAKLASLQLTTQERLLNTEETAALGKLRPLLGIAPETAVTLSGNPSTIAASKNISIERPDLAAAKLHLRATEAGIALERANRREDIAASFFATEERSEDAPNGFDNETIIGFKLSIPLPFWNNNQGNIDAATARHNRKEQEVKALANQINHESNTTLTEIRQWAALITELEDKLLPLAKEQTDLLEKSYKQGQGDLQLVLNSHQQTLELLASKIDATREFHLANIRHQASRGGNF
jgi:cobalt-zinc-cadmium efflux system outer membrane protein